MKPKPSGILVDGRERLLAAIAAKVTAEYQAELAATVDPSQRAALKEKIDREIRDRQAAVPTHALWNVGS